MSLDVYLKKKRDELPEAAKAVSLLRDNGFESFASELEARHDASDHDTLYEANITHNLTGMADAAGIYLACWHPGEMLDPETSAKIEVQRKAGNYHGPGGVYELEKTLPTVHAKDLIEPLRLGLERLRAQPNFFKTFDAPNGWGLYVNFVPWVERYLQACEEYPDAEVGVYI